jgi:hypothetical protein
MNEKNFLKQAVVLLFAALMVFSSAAVVANTSTHDAELIATDAYNGTVVNAPMSRGLVWDNVMGLAGSRGGIIVATVRTEGIAFPADDFQLDAQETVTSVAWQGGYFQCQLASGQHDYNWDWRILFWSDIGNGSWPGTVIYNQTIPDASITRSFWFNYTRPDNGNAYWVANYSCALPESITFNADTKYWITIDAIQTPNTYPQGAWCRHNSSQSPILLHEAMFIGTYWGYSNWATIMTLLIAGADPNPLPHDLNFQLFSGAAQDTTPPVTTATLAGDMSGGNYTSDVTVTLTAIDTESGVNYTMYKVDGGSWMTYSTPFVVSGNGDHIVAFYSVDNAGNIETEKSVSFTIQYPVVITITIKGGLGVSAAIKNTGTTDLTNIAWSITLDGSLIFIGKTKSGTIASLAPGESVTVKDFVIGLGKTGIAVSAGTAEASASGTVILFFVIGVA